MADEMSKDEPFSGGDIVEDGAFRKDNTEIEIAFSMDDVQDSAEESGQYHTNKNVENNDEIFVVNPRSLVSTDGLDGIDGNDSEGGDDGIGDKRSAVASKAANDRLYHDWAIAENHADFFGSNVFANPNWMSQVPINTSPKKSTGKYLHAATAAAPATTMASINTKDKKYPQDCYSFLSLHGPFDTNHRRLFFFFGLLPFMFQMSFLILLIWSKTDALHGTIGENDNPGTEGAGIMAKFASFIPANSMTIVRYTQVISMASYAVFPDSSLKDIVRAVQTVPATSKIQGGDRVGCMRLSCLLRGLQGVLAMLVTLLLVITSHSVVDIILNFTAVNFISNLDDYAFFLAMSGEFGPLLQDESERIANMDLPPCLAMTKKSRLASNKVVKGVVAMFVFISMLLIFIGQASNRVWITKSMRVQFQESTGLSEHSGCFDIVDEPNTVYTFRRRTYNSLVDENGTSSKTSFAYCRANRQWVFFENDSENRDPCDARNHGKELARSSKTDSFDKVLRLE